MRKIRAKIQKPSNKFFEFLNITNTLMGRFMPSYSSLMEFYKLKMIEKLKSENDAAQLAYEGTEKAILLVIKAHPTLCQYIFGKSPEDEISSGEFWDKVHLYEEIRTFATTIIYAVTQTASTNKTRSGESVFLGVMSVQALFEINAAGELTKKVYGYEIFEGVDLHRFKLCPVCGDIFWAFRSDKKACSKCSNAFRQKTFQNRNKAELNEKRRRNYAYNKALKKEKDLK